MEAKQEESKQDEAMQDEPNQDESKQEDPKLSIHWEYPVYHTEDEQFRGVLELHAPLQEWAARDVTDVVFLVDESGSMQGEKLRSVQEVLRSMLKHIPKDSVHLSVVGFDSTSRVHLPLTPVDETMSPTFIDQLKSRQSTNLVGGIRVSVQQFSQNRPRALVVLTDGQVNDGETNPSSIATEILNWRRLLNFNLFMVGVGPEESVDRELLRSVSEQSSGLFYEARTAWEMQLAVTRCFGEIMSVSLRDAKLTLWGTQLEDRSFRPDVRSVTPIGFTFHLGCLLSGQKLFFPFAVTGGRRVTATLSWGTTKALLATDEVTVVEDVDEDTESCDLVTMHHMRCEIGHFVEKFDFSVEHLAKLEEWIEQVEAHPGLVEFLPRLRALKEVPAYERGRSRRNTVTELLRQRSTQLEDEELPLDLPLFARSFSQNVTQEIVD